MPSADPELQERMRQRFGSIDTEGPIKYLKDAGYKLTDDWLWIPKEGVKTLRDMTQDEFECLLFLCHEWDFGGLIPQIKNNPDVMHR
jgi:hypothetical protein